MSELELSIVAVRDWLTGTIPGLVSLFSSVFLGLCAAFLND